MKYAITIIALLIFCVFLITCESCDKKPSVLEQKSNHSLKADSIQTAQNAQINKISDSIVAKLKKENSILSAENKKLSVSYYALRAIVRPLNPVKVYSLDQLVDSVKAVTYNAAINSGNMCDELLIGKDAELNVKDSIISEREIQLFSCAKENQTKAQAVNDLIALNNEEKEKVKKIKKHSNRKFFLGLAIPPALYILAKSLKIL